MLKRITHRRGGFVALAAAAAIAVTALLPGTWGTAVAQTAGDAVVTFTVNGQERTSIMSSDGRLSIDIPPGATVTGLRVFVDTGTSLTGDLMARDNARAALANLLGIESSQMNARLVGNAEKVQSADGTTLLRGLVKLNFTVPSTSLLGGRDAFVMDARSITGHGVRALQVSAPAGLGVTATMSIFVSAEAFADVGGDMSRIKVFYLNEFTGEPEPVTMLPSPGPGQIAFEWSKEGDYVIMTLPLVPLPPLDLDPVADAVPVPANTGTGNTGISTAVASTNRAAYVALAGVLAALVGVGGLGARIVLRRPQE